jgi:hypothetical protein
MGFGANNRVNNTFIENIERTCNNHGIFSPQVSTEKEHNRR